MPFEIQYTIADEANNISTTTIKVPTTFAIADYVEFGAGMAQALNDFLRGAIRGAELCFNIDISAYTNNTISAISDVEEIAAFEFVTAQGNRVKLNVPGCPDLSVLPGTNTLDVTDAEVAAIITAMEDGISGTQPCDVGGDEITEMLFAREWFRSSGRRA